MSLRSRVVPVREVRESDLARLWTLFAATYEDVDERTFREDFHAKDDVILLEDGELQGFSTLRELRVVVDGRTHVGMFSGDTVVAQPYWGTRVLGRAFIAHMLLRRVRVPWRPYWWILISKGYKTYLMMANNFHEHWPRVEQTAPSSVTDVMHAFGGALFGGAYVPSEGVVRWSEPRGRLRDGVADVTPDLLDTRPRVRFFAERNPGWVRGDELFCLARMDARLPFTYAWKMLRGSLR